MLSASSISFRRILDKNYRNNKSFTVIRVVINKKLISEYPLLYYRNED